MAKSFDQWTVLPHGKLTRISDNILSVTGRLHMPPMGEVERRMTVVRSRRHHHGRPLGSALANLEGAGRLS